MERTSNRVARQAAIKRHLRVVAENTSLPTRNSGSPAPWVPSFPTVAAPEPVSVPPPLAGSNLYFNAHPLVIFAGYLAVSAMWGLITAYALLAPLWVQP
jgi:hypothetical protein